MFLCCSTGTAGGKMRTKPKSTPKKNKVYMIWISKEDVLLFLYPGGTTC